MSISQSASYNETAKASWYSVATNGGTETASGEIFSDSEITVAHKTLPLGTIVRITNIENGKSVIARVNDRGPYVPNRIVDLSKAAFAKIADLERGAIIVNVKTVKTKENN